MILRKAVGKNSVLTLVAAVAAITALAACRRVPDDVIQPDDMSSLLADIHTGDAVVEQNRRQYSSDSLKMALKQSILARHGVTVQEFDSSLSWYARNPEKYLEVYDNTIELLRTRMNANDAQIAQGSLSVGGDSVDLWAGARYLQLSGLSPTRTVTFGIKADDNSENGDRYTWRARFVNNMPKARWGLSATYDNGTVEFLDAEVAGEGWNELEFVSDSTLKPIEIYGYISFEPRNGMAVWADSLQLVRKRRSPEAYRHRYRVKSYRR